MKGAPAVSPVDWMAAYPPPRSLSLDQEALRLYERSYAIGLQTEGETDPPITFTTVAAALLVGEDETSKWFRDQASRFGPKTEKVLAEKSITNNILKNAAAQTTVPAEPRLSSDKHLLTSSARAVLQAAESWAQRVGGTDIGVRHVVASYVLNPPPYHRAQMQRWGFDAAGWWAVFFEWVARRFTWEQWTDTSERPAPANIVSALDQPEVKGSSLAWPGDANALKILERAARDHARRDDPSLRFRTVFFALVETARGDGGLRPAVGPVTDAVSKVRDQYQRALEAYYVTAESGVAAKSFADLEISPRVLNTLETARELCAASWRRSKTDDPTVTALQLAGAFFSRRVDSDDVFIELGLDPNAVRNQLIRHAQTRGESEEVWREILGDEEATFTSRAVNLNSDDPEATIRLDDKWQSDPLHIRSDVNAFAALLASSHLEPPLSIGLFGPWGSGKTTFLKRLKQAVDDRAKEAREAQDPATSPYVSNVVHVEFNAWHYSEGALTSSLVDAVFRALSGFIKDEQVVAGKVWRDQKQQALASTQRQLAAAETLKGKALKAVSDAETNVANKRAEAAEKTTGLQQALGAVWAAAKTTLLKSREVKDSGVLDAIGDTTKSVEELRSRLESVRNRPARLIGDLGWGRTIVFAVLVLAVPPVVAWLVGKSLQAGDLGKVFSAVTALLSVVGLWLRSATGAMANVDNAIAQVVSEYERQLSEDKGVKTAARALDEALTQAQTAEKVVDAARVALARAEIEVANAALPAQMLQLVSGRIEDKSYAKELTSQSLARADLERLSLILRDQRGDAATSTSALRAVDRVILYIDDLDRCPLKDVVRVLQLVHMLLAFELFAVVVAVDAKWVEQALIDSYPWLRKDGAAAAARTPGTGEDNGQPDEVSVTAQDYLEKIFQISFWLKPMTAARAADYLRSLIRGPLRETTVDDADQEGPAAAEDPSVPTVAGTIDISALELNHMRALAGYVGPSPRRVKRLVNAYRLIKARMSDAHLRTFVKYREGANGVLRSGPYQIVIGLLVIGTGAPTAATQILAELAETDPRSQFNDLITNLRSRPAPEWQMAADVIETLMRTQKTTDVFELRGWARTVGRYLLSGP